MGRKRKEAAPAEEPGTVLEGITLSQHTAETWAVQFPFGSKRYSKLLYGSKQTAAAVRELVAIWLCYKAADRAGVGTELQQLQHGYEHYSFLIEAIKHSRSVEALWKVVGKFCRGEFEIRSALPPAQARASADESTGRSPGGARVLCASDGDGAVSSQGAAAAAQQHQPQFCADAGLAAASQGGPSLVGDPSGQGVLGADGALSSAAAVPGHPGSVDGSAEAASAALAAAAAYAALPTPAGFPAVGTATAAAALQAALMYARGGSDLPGSMLPALWQQQFGGMPASLAAYPPPAEADLYGAPGVASMGLDPATAAAIAAAAAAAEAQHGAAAEGGAAAEAVQPPFEATAMNGVHCRGAQPAQADAREPQEAAEAPAGSGGPAGAELAAQQPVEQSGAGQQQRQQLGAAEPTVGEQQSPSPPLEPQPPMPGVQPGARQPHAEPPPPLADGQLHPGEQQQQQQERQQAFEPPASRLPAEAQLARQVAGAAAELAAADQQYQEEEDIHRRLAAAGSGLDDAAAQGLLLWWQRAVSGGYAVPAAAPAGACVATVAAAGAEPEPGGTPDPKRQRV